MRSDHATPYALPFHATATGKPELMGSGKGPDVIAPFAPKVIRLAPSMLLSRLTYVTGQIGPVPGGGDRRAEHREGRRPTVCEGTADDAASLEGVVVRVRPDHRKPIAGRYQRWRRQRSSREIDDRLRTGRADLTAGSRPPGAARPRSATAARRAPPMPVALPPAPAPPPAVPATPAAPLVPPVLEASARFAVPLPHPPPALHDRPAAR